MPADSPYSNILCLGPKVPKILNFKNGGWFTQMHWSGLLNLVTLIPILKHLFVVHTQTDVAPMSAPSSCTVGVLALATLLRDASQYLAITVRNKLVYSRNIHSPLRGEIQSQMRAPLKVQRKSIHNPAVQVIAYFVLLCYFFFFFDRAIMMLGINRMVNGSLLVWRKMKRRGCGVGLFYMW